MDIVVVDHTGRGHAYADLFVRTNPDVTVHLAPGCASIADERVIGVPGMSITDPGPVVEYATRIGADLALVGHPRPLTEGFVDAFRAAGIPAIGPDRSAARLESSKLFTKQLCDKYGVRTAGYRYFEDPEPALAYVRSAGRPLVVKGNESCQGNGVFVCETAQEAEHAIGRLMIERAWGSGGDRVIVEEKLVGREVLFFAIVGGGDYLVLPMAVDYQRSDDGNQGVMCGGMGAFSPSPDETPEQLARFEAQMMRPLLDAMVAENLDYTGIIYIGCMLDGDELSLIEINARMGDPEAEVVFPRITTDFTGVCQAILDGRLGEHPPLDVVDEYFVNVVASQGPLREYRDGAVVRETPGWPYGAYATGQPISGIDQVDRDTCQVFYGAVRTDEHGRVVSDGGKCLNLVGRGPTLEDAAVAAYNGIAEIDFPGIRYRTDIGKTMPWD